MVPMGSSSRLCGCCHDGVLGLYGERHGGWRPNRLTRSRGRRRQRTALCNFVVVDVWCIPTLRGDHNFLTVKVWRGCFTLYTVRSPNDCCGTAFFPNYALSRRNHLRDFEFCLSLRTIAGVKSPSHKLSSRAGVQNTQRCATNLSGHVSGEANWLGVLS